MFFDFDDILIKKTETITFKIVEYSNFWVLSSFCWPSSHPDEADISFQTIFAFRFSFSASRFHCNQDFDRFGIFEAGSVRLSRIIGFKISHNHLKDLRLP